MLQSTALNILKTGASVFLTGEPGSGKSYTIKQYVDYLAQNGVYASVTASTGIAATHIGGMTIHSWAGIGIKESLSIYDIEALHEKEYIVKRLLKAKVLIIDEISMLSGNTFDMVNAVCKSIRQVEDRPFGGLQVICVGDFFQLPPIIKKSTNSLELFEDNGFVFSSSAWKELKPLTCYLSEQHRQSDAKFTKTLAQIRSNTVDEEVHDVLRSRVVKELTVLPDATKLYSHNAHVDTVNNREIGKLEGKVKIYGMTMKGKETMTASLIKSCLSPEKLELKIGAKVMFTKNNPDKGFVNGTTGTLVEFHYDVPRVKVANGMTIDVEPMDWSIQDQGKILASITQIPLRLAWAITIHKSQGMSLDAAIMDLSQVFEYGQGYVALSRVRTLDGLHVIGYNDRALQVHPRVQEEDELFKEQSKEAEVQIFQMDKGELSRIQDKYISSIAGVKKGEEKEKEKKTTGKKNWGWKTKTKKKVSGDDTYKVEYEGDGDVY
ncbi:MAG: PIF1 family DEAD/DEAH box helicase [Patescibacteria group bacterium]